MIAQDVVPRALEGSEGFFGGDKILQGGRRLGRLVLILKVAKLDEKVGVLVVHDLDTLGDFAYGVAVVPAALGVAVGIVDVGEHAEADRAAAGSAGRSRRTGGGD